MTTEESPFGDVPTPISQLSWPEQDELLRQYWEELKPPEEIAQALGRSVAAVMTRAARLGLPRRAAPGRKRGYRRTDAPRHEKAVRIRVRKEQATEGEEEYGRAYEVKMRVCLMCLKKFESQGSHNRICPGCKGSADYATGSSTPDFVFEVGK